MSAALPALPAGQGAPPPASRRFDHVRALFVQTPATLIGNFVGWCLIALMYWPLAAPGPLRAWMVAAALLMALRLAHYLRFRRTPEPDDALMLRWRQSWKLLVLAQASMWGLAVWLFWGLGTPHHMTALLLIAVSYCLGSVQLLATQQRLFIVFTGLVLAPAILRIATDTAQAWNWQLAGILCLLFAIVLVMGRAQRSALDQVIRLKSHTDKLAAQLQVEMGVAEKARHAAEAASRAKTQFFAAASHDLRQPLHAMGLFAEALRQRTHDPEVASLVNSINESVDALEGLFGELLDITRIDTGGVDVNPAPVPMRELFARLRLHFEPTAFEKGLALSFHGGQRVAFADPVILERILRNLVSNAIRYTDDGGVLVSCRQRGGKLLMQVWDSGIGISEGSLPRIFDEFYQVQSQRPLQAHQRKGLGLGLAIVARLAGLLEAPISVRSRVGHGTVFSFEVPPGKVVRALEPAMPRARAPLGLTLQGRLMLLVEDEPAVREGLVVLLKAWGASVLDFDSVASLQAWLAGGPVEAPDLLLVDYRLPQGLTGLDALAAARAHWPSRTLPAIVITGSTIGGHESEAAEHDFHLLIKPVLPNKLRAMIAFKLGVR
ncbi:MAG: ATP-binding protein [Burkholderiaceae bacterium]|jgi:signal transduction histidine kinase/CheY-like chemotaxis protein|nr:ATP-binding protein [Burkholderiaceae bacterium]